MIRLFLIGCLLLALTVAALSLHVPGSGSVGTAERYQHVVELLCASAAVYFVAVALVLRHPGRTHSAWLILAFAAAMRLPLLIAPPFLSSDINRYVWDGRVQAAGINPYRYVPADPSLMELRDEAVYPHINRADYAPTIYPPAAQAVFGIVGLTWPTVAGMKLVMTAFELLGIGCLWQLLAAASLPTERILIYAWNPLPLWAFAGNGHVDAMVVGLVAAALLLRARQHDAWAGVAVGLAVATKFLPAVIIPALWRRRGGWKLAVAAGITVLALYAAYSNVGWRVLGFLPGYGQEEGLDNGTGFWILALLDKLMPLPAYAPPLYLAFAALGLLCLGAWIAFGRRPNDPVAICQSAAVLMAGVTFAISPHYPWYFAWLAVPSVLAPMPAALWLSAAPVLIYLASYNDNLVWPSVIFAPALLLALWPAKLR